MVRGTDGVLGCGARDTEPLSAASGHPVSSSARSTREGVQAWGMGCLETSCLTCETLTVRHLVPTMVIAFIVLASTVCFGSANSEICAIFFNV